MTSSKLFLSIIIPVYNEEKTIGLVLKKLAKLELPVQKEIIVVDDGSTDNSRSVIESTVGKDSTFRLFPHEKNLGKGAAVRTGITKAKGDYIIIQDADLEYDPTDIGRLVKEIKDPDRDVVYGTRLKRLPHFNQEERTFQFLLHYAGNKFLSLVTSALYGVWVTDMETCYKLFPRKAVEGIILRARGFELEPELTAKLLKKKLHLIEVPITTKPRGYDEGKKLNTVRDGYKAVWALVKYRFVS